MANEDKNMLSGLSRLNKSSLKGKVFTRVCMLHAKMLLICLLYLTKNVEFDTILSLKIVAQIVFCSSSVIFLWMLHHRMPASAMPSPV